MTHALGLGLQDVYQFFKLGNDMAVGPNPVEIMLSFFQTTLTTDWLNNGNNLFLGASALLAPR